MKKFLLLALALVMLLSCTAAFADEPVHLVWWMGCTSDAPIDWAEVEDALNAYSAEKIGVTCEFKYMTSDQISRATDTGEYFDIAFTCDWYNDFATNAARGMFLDITDMINDYPALKDSVLDIAWPAGAYNGRIYAVPHMKDIGMEIFWIIDSDYYLNEKGLEADHYISFDGIESYLEMYKKDHPDDYPYKMAYSGITSWQNCLVDWISMEYLIGLDWDAQGTEDELKVKTALEVPRWIERLRTIHSWYEKGYINPDAAVTESMGRSVAGVVQSGQGWFGAETIWSNARQKASYISRYDGPYMSSSSIRGSMTAISAATPHAKEAMALIELMNTDPTYREIARYGIEGKHYIKNDDGTVTKTDLGNTNMSLWAYTQGHYTLGPVEASAFESVPADPDQWAKVFEGYKDATMTSMMGFTFDIAPVETQCLAIASIIEEYKRELYTGTSDPDVVIPEMLERMNEVGLQDVLAEAQAQLDAFKAAEAK
ncbi:MAG: ABC transporter substrate-binding protein [Clostridia bacterium]|nr:ABC transporter substrate-binding protein [Clostridia bacterium]